MRVFDSAKSLSATVLSLVALCCASCDNSPEALPPEPPATAPASVPVDEVTLEVANKAKLAEVLASHRGKVVLVDYWSTSCVPCVEKLPEVLALQKELGDRGLQVVTLSMDDPDSRKEIGEFLKGKGAVGLHLISEFGASPHSLEEFEIDLVPHYRIYNRDGELAEKIEPAPDSPPLEFSQIKEAVERLL